MKQFTNGILVGAITMAALIALEIWCLTPRPAHDYAGETPVIELRDC